MFPKTIAWINDVPWANSGMAIQSRMVVSHLLECGYNVYYLAWHSGTAGTKTKYAIANNKAIDVFFLGQNSFGAPGLIRLLLQNINPDIIVSFGDLHMIQGLFALEAQLKNKWVHWWTVDDATPSKDILEMAQKLSSVIAITEFGAGVIQEYLARSVPVIGHAYQLPLGLGNKAEAKQKLGITKDTVVYGCIARNFWRKNLHSLLNAFAHVNNILCTGKEFNARLLIHTDTANPGFEGCNIPAKVKQLGLSGKVLLSDNSLDNDNMATIIDAMDYHVLPSYGEGFGVPVIETMARGVPNIVPKHTTLPELVADSGFVIPLELSGNVHPATGREYFGPDCFELANTILETYDIKTYSHEVYQSKQAMALAQAKKYSPEVIQQNWLNFIQCFKPKQSTDESINNIISGAGFQTNKKRLLLCSMFYVPNLIGGGEYTAHELMKGLVQRGWEVIVLTLFDGIKGKLGAPLPDKQLILDGVKIVQSGNNWYNFLTQVLDYSQPDILMTYEISSWYSLRFLREAKKRQIKTVMYEQYWRLLTVNFDNISQQSPNPPQQGLECNRKTDLLITNSDFTSQIFAKLLGRQTPVVYPPINLPSKLPTTVQKQYVVMVNPTKAKGVDVPLYLASALPQIKFKLVGAIGEDSTFVEIKKHPNVVYVPHTEDMDEIYQDAIVVLFPSMLEESFGRVVVEAMGYGIPVIARNIGAVYSVVEDYATLLPRDSKPNDWIQPLLDAIKKPRHSCNEIRSFALQKFAPNKILDNFESLLQNLYKKQKKHHDITIARTAVVVCDAGFHGVKTALEYAEKHFPNDMILCTIDACVGSDQFIDVAWTLEATKAKFIIYAGWTDNYLAIIKKVKQQFPHVRHIINWHSPLAQTELSGEHDVDAFIRCNQLLTAKEIEYILVPFKKDADLFKQSFHQNYRWFPDTMFPITGRKKTLESNLFKIGFFALPSARKNILSQMAAVRLLHIALQQNSNIPWQGVKIYVGNGFDRYKPYIDFLQMLNIPYTTLPHFHDKQEYFDYLSSMNLNIQVTFSEAFNYVCAESLALGVPCMGSTMTPALCSNNETIQTVFDHALVVQKIDNTIDLFEKMLAIACLNSEDYNKISNICKEHINLLTSMHNEAIKEVLLELEQA